MQEWCGGLREGAIAAGVVSKMSGIFGRRMTAIIAIVSIAFLVQLSTATIYDFEDELGSGWQMSGLVNWSLDSTHGLDGGQSLRSGAIQTVGSSIISREVQGPAEIMFWWEKSDVAGPIGKGTQLTFAVDGAVQRVCDSLTWDHVSYSIPDGQHTVTWKFKKITSYPMYQGAGWIDDVSISPEEAVREDRFEADLSQINQSLRENKERIGRLEENVSGTRSDLNRMEANISQIGGVVGNISGEVSGIRSDLNRTEVNIDQIGEAVGSISENVSGIWSNLKEVEGNIISINGSLKDIGNNTSRMWSNLTRMWINRLELKPCDRFVSPGEDLQAILNNSSDRVVCLEEGNYSGPFCLRDANNLVLRSAEMWDSQLVGNASDSFVIELDNCSNVSLEYLTVEGGKDGILIVNGCRDCIIRDNHIINFTENGTSIIDSSYIYAFDNLIGSTRSEENEGIDIIRSNHSFIADNTIKVRGTAIVLTKSYYNIIVVGYGCSFAEFDICNGLELDQSYLLAANCMPCETMIGKYKCYQYKDLTSLGSTSIEDINSYSCNWWYYDYSPF